LGIPISEWKRLSRIDRKALFYFRVIENYYIDRAHKKAMKEAKRKQRGGGQDPEFLNKFPKLNFNNRGSRRGG